MKSMYRFYGVLAAAVLLCLVGIVYMAFGHRSAGGEARTLILVSEVTLPFKEPSGIAWSDDLQCMWIVSGADQHVYRLDTNGRIQQQLSFVGTDLEGITYDESDSTLWIVDEAMKELVHIDRSGTVLLRKKFAYRSTRNKGLEGITIGPDKRLYILNERSPSRLFRLDARHEICDWVNLEWAADYSDLTFDKSTNTFLILSDKSKALYVWTPQQGVLCTYDLPDENNEGIAYDNARNIFYVVNDKTAKLFFYRRG